MQFISYSWTAFDVFNAFGVRARVLFSNLRCLMLMDVVSRHALSQHPLSMLQYSLLSAPVFKSHASVFPLVLRPEYFSILFCILQYSPLPALQYSVFTPLCWLHQYETLHKYNQHNILKAAARNLPAARLRLGWVECSCQTTHFVRPQPPALFHVPLPRALALL